MTLAAAIIPVTPFQQNCALIWDQDTKRGVVIDPGGDVARIEGAIAEAGEDRRRRRWRQLRVDDPGFAPWQCLHDLAVGIDDRAEPLSRSSSAGKLLRCHVHRFARRHGAGFRQVSPGG